MSDRHETRLPKHVLNGSAPVSGREPPATVWVGDMNPRAAQLLLRGELDHLLRAARPRLVRLARRQGVRDDEGEDVAQEALLVAWRRLDRRDLEVLLDHALAHLSAGARELVALCYLADLPQREVAVRLGLTLVCNVGALQVLLASLSVCQPGALARQPYRGDHRAGRSTCRCAAPCRCRELLAINANVSRSARMELQ